MHARNTRRTDFPRVTSMHVDQTLFLSMIFYTEVGFEPTKPPPIYVIFYIS